MKSIEELKAIIKDDMIIKNDDGESIIIKRYPNNVLRLDGKLVSWLDLYNLLSDDNYKLIITEIQGSIFNEGKQKNSRAGRKKMDEDKKKKRSLYTLSPDALKFLDVLCEKYDKKKSGMIELLIRMEYSKLK